MTDDNTSARLATHDARLTGLEQGVKDIVTAVSLLSNELREESRRRAEQTRTPWGVIFAGIGVLLTFLIAIGGLAYAPVMSNQNELKLAMRQIDRDMVPRVEHEKIWAFQQRLSELYQRRIDRLEDDIYRKGRASQ